MSLNIEKCWIVLFDVINFCSWPLMAYFLCIADLFILFFFGQSFGEATLPPKNMFSIICSQ